VGNDSSNSNRNLFSTSELEVPVVIRSDEFDPVLGIGNIHNTNSTLIHNKSDPGNIIIESSSLELSSRSVFSQTSSSSAQPGVVSQNSIVQLNRDNSEGQSVQQSVYNSTVAQTLYTTISSSHQSHSAVLGLHLTSNNSNSSYFTNLSSATEIVSNLKDYSQTTSKENTERENNL